MKIKTLSSLLLVFGGVVLAQPSSYLGPGILTRGADRIGSRAGAPVDLRFFAGVNAIYDTGIRPYALDSAGKVLEVNGLYGTDVGLGVYGSHLFQRGTLGIDYHGDFRHYNQDNGYDGTDQSLALGYSYRATQHLSLDFREVFGLSSFNNYFSGSLPALYDTGFDPSTFLFDNRSTYLQTSVDASYALSARTGFTVGGNWNRMWRQANALAGVKGYGFNGSIYHAYNSNTTVGVSYAHTFFDYTGSYGQTSIDTAQVFVTRRLPRNWTVLVSAGAFRADVEGLAPIQLDPVLAALLGTSTVILPFSHQTIQPNWDANIAHSFSGGRHLTYSFGYHHGISPGNGLYLASHQDVANGGVSYTGIRKWSFSVYGSYSRLRSIGQDNFPVYQQFSGGTNASWTITPALFLTASYSPRGYNITGGDQLRGYSTSIGLTFSPGDIPISFR